MKTFTFISIAKKTQAIQEELKTSEALTQAKIKVNFEIDTYS